MPEHPFKRFAQAHQERAQLQDEIRYEEQQVLFTLKSLRVPKQVWSVLRDRAVQDRERCGRLLFSAFNNEYPAFPYLLGADTLGGVKLHLEPTATLPATFENFMGTPQAKAYLTFYQRKIEQACGRGVGLVFRRHGFRHGLVLTDKFPDALPYHCGFIGYQGGAEGENKPFRLYVLHFQHLLAAIYDNGHGWHAE